MPKISSNLKRVQVIGKPAIKTSLWRRLQRFGRTGMNRLPDKCSAKWLCRHAIPNCRYRRLLVHEVPLRTLFNLSKLSLTVHCWRIYTVTDGSRTQLSELQSPHCCRNLKQISCTRGVAFFCPAKLDKHCNYSFKFSEGLSAGLWVFLIGMRIFGVYETERILAVARIVLT